MAKTGRPIAKNIDYFPHQCKDDKELIYIRLKFGSEGYEATIEHNNIRRC